MIRNPSKLFFALSQDQNALHVTMCSVILTRNSYLLLFALYHDQDALYVLLWNDQIIRFKASELLDESKTDKDLNQVITYCHVHILVTETENRGRCTKLYY